MMKHLKTSHVKGDRISALTDDLLLQIMSWLQLKDVVATNLLSKRWRTIWAEFPILSFHHVGDEDRERFVMFLNRVLHHRQSLKIQEICIRLNYVKSLSSDVDVWLQIVTKSLEEISLLFKDYWKEGIDYYVLPRCLLNNPTMKKLSLSLCAIKHPEAINWKSLKMLSLSRLSLTNDVIRHILSATPALEVLNLRYCYQYNYIDIKSKRLTKLVIHNHYGCNSDNQLDTVNVLSISAPYVESLEISGYLDMPNFLLIDPSSVIDANINFSILNEQDGFGFIEEYPTIVKQVLEKLKHVKSLMLGETCSEALVLLSRTQMPSPFSNLVCLNIGPELSDWEIPGTSRFLELTPVLETLVFNMETMRGWFEPQVLQEPLHWRSQKWFLTPMLLTLKTFKIVGFRPDETEMEVIWFLLGNAKVLQNLIIERSKLANLDELPLSTARILSYPRCSPDVVILFSDLQ